MNIKLLKTLISLFCSIFLIYILNNKIYNTPPLGKILDPFHGVWQNAENSAINFSKKSLKILGIKDLIEIKFDSNLIPHISSKNDYDMYFAIGFVSALHRLWYIDFTSRATEGRLSEIFGYNEKILKYDKLQRQKGFKVAAKSTLNHVLSNKESTECIKAYSAGINAYIKSLKYKDLPIEYKLLDYKPELWTPYKTMLIIISMTDKLSGKDTALEHTNALKLFGRKKFDFLYPDFPEDIEPIIPLKAWEFDPIPIKKPDFCIPDCIPKINLPNTKPKKGGSNSWALSGKKTVNGCPYFANDPHLDISLPSLFYLIHAKSPNQNIIGALGPGTPLIAIGFNPYVAWGITNSLMTSRDWFLIQFEDESMKEYKYDGKIFKTQIINEEIKIRNKPSIFQKIIYTHLGPIFYSERSDIDKTNFKNKKAKNIAPTKNDEKEKPYGLAMKWSGHNIGNIILGFMRINRAKNHSEFEKGLELFDINVNYGSAYVNGDISMNVVGKYVARWKEQGRFIMSGNISDYEWQSYIPKKHNPKILNPAKGYVSSANQHPTYKSYPYYHHGYWYRHYRNKRINKLLESKKKFNLNDMKKIQFDTLDSSAEEFLPIILPYINISNLNDSEKRAYKILQNWDYNNQPNKFAPSIYREWIKIISNNLWKSIISLNKDIRPPRLHTTIQIIKKYPKSPFLDFGDFKDMSTLINQSFKKAISNLEKWKSINKLPYIWKNYNRICLKHIIPGFKSFGIMNVCIGGGKNCLNYNESNDVGVSIRFIAELCKRKVNGLFIYPGGQSGNPGSPYYSNFANKWSKGEYISLSISKDENEKIDYLYKLNLEPK